MSLLLCVYHVLYWKKKTVEPYDYGLRAAKVTKFGIKTITVVSYFDSQKAFAQQSCRPLQTCADDNNIKNT